MFPEKLHFFCVYLFQINCSINEYDKYDIKVNPKYKIIVSVDPFLY